MSKKKRELDFGLLADFFPDRSTPRRIKYSKPKPLYPTRGRKVEGNRTPFPRANKIAKSPLVEFVEYEIESGFWAYLIDDYNWQSMSFVHEFTIEEVEAELKNVTKGAPSE